MLSRRKIEIAIIALLLVAGIWAVRRSTTSLAQAPMEPAALARKVELYYRNLFALGTNLQVTVSPPQPASVPGLVEVSVTISDGRGTNRERALVSPDGHYLLRGEIRDMTKDPYADTRAAIKLDGQPSRGPADAPVTLVLYSDFQCPYCREMHNLLETKILKNHPEVRLVYKDAPIVEIHPWAMPAAIAGQCAYVQSSAGFWKVYNSFFENQRELNLQNIQQKAEGFAVAAGLDLGRFKACVANNEVRARVQESMREMQTLGLDSTPTLFINGRRVVGNVPEQVLERVIQYELEQHGQKPATSQETKPKANS